MNEYPKVLRHGKRGVVVRFTERCVGVVVGIGHTDGFRLGHRSTTWNMHVFTDYKPEIFETKG